MNPDIQRIHEFWFTGSPSKWFWPPDGFDKVCNQEFGSLVQRARTNELDDWASDPRSSLALLVLLDQFPRNIYRGTPEAFSSDAKALDIATRAIAKGWDKEVHFLQALTFYLPLCHNEGLLSNVASVVLNEDLQRRAPASGEEKRFVEDSLRAAITHRDVILRFGRYPGRNKALGRPNTEEEEEFLKKHPAGLPPPGEPM